MGGLPLYVGWDLIILNVKELTSRELPHRALGSLCERGGKTCGLHKSRESSWPAEGLVVHAETREYM
jgi:hypothetical protein